MLRAGCVRGVGDDGYQEPLFGERNSRREGLLLLEGGAAAFDERALLHWQHEERDGSAGAAFGSSIAGLMF